MRDFDVIVVGAGPAGCSSAIKCSKLGFNTLLVEKEPNGRHKSCGGVLPCVSIDLIDELGLKVPEKVMCSPQKLGLFYVPPSGKKNGGCIKDYKFLNVNRDRFDEWLMGEVKLSDAQILYETEFLEFEGTSNNFIVTVKTRDSIAKLTARSLIGADGVFSKVRKQLCPNFKMKTVTILQEYWRAEGDFGEYFYVFFKGKVTPTYGYVIPKDGLFVVGTGAPKEHSKSVSECLSRFKTWLQKEFTFNPLSLELREAAAIPYGSPISGEDNVILVGDAAGFCNSLSGEGIRLAIESGIAAGEAIKQQNHEGGVISELYYQRVEDLNEFVSKTYDFAISLTDKRREDFVRTELARSSFTSNIH